MICLMQLAGRALQIAPNEASREDPITCRWHFRLLGGSVAVRLIVSVTTEPSTLPVDDLALGGVERNGVKMRLLEDSRLLANEEPLEHIVVAWSSMTGKQSSLNDDKYLLYLNCSRPDLNRHCSSGYYPI